MKLEGHSIELLNHRKDVIKVLFRKSDFGYREEGSGSVGDRWLVIRPRSITWRQIRADEGSQDKQICKRQNDDSGMFSSAATLPLLFLFKENVIFMQLIT